MSAQQIPAKGLLHSFLIQATKGKPPCYVTSDAKNIQGQFECTCTLPPVCIATGSFDAQTFTGIGTSKKLAAAKAADLAWAFVQQTKSADALLYKQAKHDLWAAICSSLTAEVSPTEAPTDRCLQRCMHSTSKGGISCCKLMHTMLLTFC